YGLDMEKAASDIREAASTVVLPAGAQDTSISRISMNTFPVITLSVSDEALSMEELTKVIENEVKPGFEGLNGGSDVSIAGQQLKEVQLTFNQAKMKEL
ncbi:efflux RND transporter permease subunit, partial [Bacillus cereus]|nr:efflux RND transporter permease subunit [Bacillus cereus]